MATKTDQQRYDAAIKYLEGVDRALALDVGQRLRGRVAEASQDISLKGEGYWRSGNNAQHNVVRALILCQKAT